MEEQNEEALDMNNEEQFEVAFGTDSTSELRETLIQHKIDSSKSRSKRYEVEEEDDTNDIDLTARETLEDPMSLVE